MNDQSEKVLITGGAGFIGSWLVRKLLHAGKQVVVLDDLSSGTIDNLPIKNINLKVVIGSVLDQTSVSKAAQGVGLVLHLAGVVGMRLATKQRDLAFRIATEGTFNILEATGNAPIVLFSSSAIYGYTKSGTAQEDAVLSREAVLEYDGGQPGYATGKWEMERIGLAAAQQGRSILCVRPFNVVGPGQRDTYGMVLPTFIRQALTGKPLQIYDDGLQSRTFSGVWTFVECIDRLIENHDVFSDVGNILNIGTTKPTQIRELAQIVIEETGKSFVPIEYIPYDNVFPNHRDVRWRVPEARRISELLGTVRWPNIREVVRSVVTSVANNLPVGKAHPGVYTNLDAFEPVSTKGSDHRPRADHLRTR